MNLDSSAFIADQELIEALEKRSTLTVCEEDRVLFRQGDSPTGLFILRTGTGTLTMDSPGGDEVTCIPVFAGSLLGLPGLIGDKPYTLTAKVQKGAELGYVEREDFKQLMLTEPRLSLHVLRVLAAEVRTARFSVSEP